ncbi:LysR family transcriptional regulator [Herbiconiux moechotypicola]|uniref:LysR family transcriptional regulator n=2 Tax=Herbiconiux moechotypicola TaxID=637393 RepID=A0ABN3DCR1_9MICO
MLAALERLGTIAAVAEELHLTAPGVSMQLAALERELGLALTRRQGRRVVLTPAGTVLALHGHDILDRLSMAELELEALRAGSSGRYALTAFPSAARTIIAEACRHLLTDPGSGLELTLTTLEPEDALSALATGTADLAVVHSYSNVARELPAGVNSTMLGSEPVRLAVRSADRRSSTGGTIELGEYDRTPWITPTRDVTCFDMVDRACGLAGFRPRVVAETMDFAVQLELVAAGVGVALVPSLAVERLPDGVELLDLAHPVERALALAVREPSRADAGVRAISGAITAAAAARLTR